MKFITLLLYDICNHMYYSEKLRVIKEAVFIFAMVLSLH